MAANAFIAVLLLAVAGVSVTSAVRCYSCEAQNWEYNKMQTCAYSPWNKPANTTYCDGRCFFIYSPDEYGSAKHVKRGCTTMEIPEGCGEFNGMPKCHRLCDSDLCNTHAPDMLYVSAAATPWGLAFSLVMMIMGLFAHALL